MHGVLAELVALADDRVRIEIGFDGGQIMGALVSSPARPTRSSARSARAPTALALEAEDGRYTIVARRIVYVKRFARESRVGFAPG